MVISDKPKALHSIDIIQIFAKNPNNPIRDLSGNQVGQRFA